MPAIFVFSIFGVRMGELREARIPMRPAIGVLLRPTGYIFIVLAWLYDTISNFYLFNKILVKQAWCAHRIATLTHRTWTINVPNEVGGAKPLKSTGKNAYEMKVAVNAKTHIRKRYTHAIAKVSILSRQNSNSSGTATRVHTYKIKGHMEGGHTRTFALGRA